jgi:phenylalanyl-tRNA synthetase beta chain
MKVSVNWVKQFADIDLPLYELVEKIGAQLGAVEEVMDLGKKYQGIAVVRVVFSERHPNADKLTVCKIDDGGVIKKIPRDTHGYIQVVCGAPNVEAGMLAAWIPPGSAVPSTIDKEPLAIESREVRGVLSHGMLASAQELGFSDDHSGLLVIDEDITPGTGFAKAFRLDDHIIDIENKMFTHRPDCFGMLGVAREIAGITNQAFSSPNWYLSPKPPTVTASHKLGLEVKNDLPKLVPRFCAIAISDVAVGPSPLWLQSYLMRVGLRPINNIVDLTNFVMYETGQPLHAYDYDKLNAKQDVAVIGVRHCKKGEKLKLLGGKEISLEAGSIIITDGQRPVGLGGVMGGADTEVDEETRNIVLEAANFNMNAIRQSAMTYGLFTDAATRFTKNQNPAQIPAVIIKAAEDVLKLAGGQIASSLIDDGDTPSPPPSIKTTEQFVNSRLGLELSAAQVVKILNNVEIKASHSGSSLTIVPPFWRTDVEIAEDVVEEVGRLHGYDHLPLKLPPRDLAPAKPDRLLQFKSKVRSILSAAGANETLTYSFVHGSLLKNVGQDPKDAYHIRNALSPDLQHYRLSLIPSLLEKVHPNIKAGLDEFAIFEIGKGHLRGAIDRERLPNELDRIALVVASKNSRPGSSYFAARKICDYLLNELGIQGAAYEQVNRQRNSKTATYYDPDRTALITVNGQKIGRVGEFKQSVSSALKLPKYCAGFALHTNELMNLSTTTTGYRPLNRFPGLDQDLCLRSSVSLSYVELTDFLHQQLEKAAQKHGYGFDIEPLDIFQRPSDKSHKQTTWRITLWHPQRTLTTVEANKLMDELAKAAANRLKTVRI